MPSGHVAELAITASLLGAAHGGQWQWQWQWLDIAVDVRSGLTLGQPPSLVLPM